jgi:hypothetical protein
VCPDPTATGGAAPIYSIVIDGIAAWSEPQASFYTESSEAGWREPPIATWREPKVTVGT